MNSPQHWSAKAVADQLNKLFGLQGASCAKLKWYVNDHKIFKDKNNSISELIEEKKTQITNGIATIKSALLTYDQILTQASSELRHPIRALSGIYFLIDSTLPKEESIVYVGQAKSILNRLSGHFWKMHKEFDNVAFIEVELKIEGNGPEKIYTVNHDRLNTLEALYIWHLRYPKYNASVGKTDELIKALLYLV